MPINGLPREGRPSSVTYGDSFSLRAKCRLRRLRFDTRLRAQPRGGSLLQPQHRFDHAVTVLKGQVRGAGQVDNILAVVQRLVQTVSLVAGVVGLLMDERPHRAGLDVLRLQLLDHSVAVQPGILQIQAEEPVVRAKAKAEPAKDLEDVLSAWGDDEE